MQLDVTDAASIHAAKDTIEKAEEKLDVLVNNAGMSSVYQHPKRCFSNGVHRRIGINPKTGQNAATIPLSTARDVMEVNYFGVIQTTVTLLPLVRKSTNGVIVNVSSISGSNTFQADPNRKLAPGSPAHLNTNSFVAYRSSKAGLNSYTIALARELKGEGIKVNSVTPGLTSTNLSGRVGKTSKAGAEVLLPWALLEEDGPTGMHFEWAVNILRWLTFKLDRSFY